MTDASTRWNDVVAHVHSIVTGFDALELSSRIGALLLDRSNAGRTASLEALQGIICNAPGGEGPPLSASKFRHLISGCENRQIQLLTGDDPAENVFARRIISVSGSFVAVVGPSTDLPDGLQLVISSIEKMSTSKISTETVKKVDSLIRGAIALSTKIDSRLSSLVFSDMENSSGKIRVPPKNELEGKAQELRFTESELENIVGSANWEFVKTALTMRME